MTNCSQESNGNAALAIFNRFSDSTSFLEILQLFKDLCQECELDHEQYVGIIQGLKAKLTSWKCQEIFKIYESKAGHPVYKNQECCRGKRCLVVGAGPVGLRTAIEAALLGARVDVVEKRNDFSRNNVLHLWPFLLTDLRNLGAKRFYGKFCSGDLDHISIRMLQAILLKAALLLGVKVHPSVEFKSVVEPSGGRGWRVEVCSNTCPVNTYDFEVMMGADGKKYVLPGFRTKEFRPKLAIAITANFVNNGTQEEAKVQEISGISYIYHQSFFNRLAEEHGIELENVVYYRDETHYFVMTAKKQSLLRRGVLIEDLTDAQQLLSAANISAEALKQYAKEVAVYSTKGGFKMESLGFQKNHRGQDDVALFDFTSLSAAENAARIVERGGKTVLMCLVGDSLIEPFWPTGSGCARGFLGVMDAAWMMKGFGEGRDPLELIEERESTLQLLSQTKPERLHKNFQAYSIDPSTRYLDLAEMVATGDLSHLYDTGQGPQQPTVVTKSGLACGAPRKAGVSARVKRNKTIGGLKPREASAIREKINEDICKQRSKDDLTILSSDTRGPRFARSHSIRSVKQNWFILQDAAKKNPKEENGVTGNGHGPVTNGHGPVMEEIKEMIVEEEQVIPEPTVSTPRLQTLTYCMQGLGRVWLWLMLSLLFLVVQVPFKGLVLLLRLFYWFCCRAFSLLSTGYLIPGLI